jgi:DNA-binding NarL/FixJ family response regulator
MRVPATKRASLYRSIVWIADAHRLDYEHLLADTKARQLEIRFFASGRELLHDWFAGAPDVCVVNLQLPDLGGFNIVEMLRPFPEGTTVCTLTDHYAAEEEIRALSLGVHSYLCKPLEAAVFFSLCLCPKAKRDLARRAAAALPVHCFSRAAKTTRSISIPKSRKGGS